MLQHALLYMRGKPKPIKRNGEYSKKTGELTLDLIRKFPELASHRIAEALGVHEKYVKRVRLGLRPQRGLSVHQHNINSTNAELAALRRAHDRYEDDPRVRFEAKATHGPTLVINNDRAHYKADQSHSIKRPITLPTKPFDIAA